MGRALIIAVLAIAGCGGTGGAGGDVVVRDSAGVRIVENPGALSGVLEWLIEASPALEIGGEASPPEAQLFRVRHAFRLDDGRIVVADPSERVLKYFDADGRYLRSAGGGGEGPGEFEQLSYAARIADDSILTYDFGLHRATVFDASGTYARDYRLAGPDGGPAPANVIGSFSDGSVLAQGFIDLGGHQPDGLERHQVALYRFDPTGERAAEFGSFPTAEMWFDPVGEGGFSIYTPLFGRTVNRIASGNRLYMADSERYEIEVRTPDGAVELLVRRAVEPRRVTGDATAALKEEHVGRAGDENRRREARRIYDAMTVPETMPAFARVHVDDLGHVWVEDYRAPGDAPPAWAVFDSEGVLVARATLPDRFQPLQIGRDFLLGVWRDPFDVEHLRTYRLNRN